MDSCFRRNDIQETSGIPYLFVKTGMVSLAHARLQLIGFDPDAQLYGNLPGRILPR